MKFDFVKKGEQLREAQRKLSSMTGNEENYAQVEREYNALAREYKNELLLRQGTSVEQQGEKGFNFMKALRESGREGLNLRAAITASGDSAKLVETEMQQILEPLYAKSVLSQLGVRWYKGMPMGNISVPVMNAGTVNWATEVGDSTDGTPSFGTNVTLTPHRLTAFFDITEQMLMQDTVGVEDAIKRDAINALTNKLEATIFGNAAGTNSQPKGMFNGATFDDASDFNKVCELESKIEDANVYGEVKYLLSTKAKADLRTMPKSEHNSALVMEHGLVDGTEAISTSLVKDGNKGIYCFGDFSNLAVAAWGDIIFKRDDSVAYKNGKVRIYVTGYFDAAVLRKEAFVFGNTRPNALASHDAESSSSTGSAPSSDIDLGDEA